MWGVAKVLQQLVRAGIANASRGVGGGYRLARPATEVTVQDVIELFEPSAAPDTCMLRDVPGADCFGEGEAPCPTVEEALEQFGGDVDGFWMPDRPLRTSADVPRASALVEATSWPFRLLREGPRPLPDPDSPARGRA